MVVREVSDENSRSLIDNEGRNKINIEVFFKTFLHSNRIIIKTIVILSKRFLAVVYPVSSLPYRTPRMTKMAILLTWTVILLSNTPVWLAHVTMKINNGICNIVICREIWFHLLGFVNVSASRSYRRVYFGELSANIVWKVSPYFSFIIRFETHLSALRRVKNLVVF